MSHTIEVRGKRITLYRLTQNAEKKRQDRSKVLSLSAEIYDEVPQDLATAHHLTSDEVRQFNTFLTTAGEGIPPRVRWLGAYALLDAMKVSAAEFEARDRNSREYRRLAKEIMNLWDTLLYDLVKSKSVPQKKGHSD